MRDLIIKRIEVILSHSSPQDMRWQNSWWDKDYNHVGKLTRKVAAKVNPTHIFQIDWKTLGDDKLLFFFEYVVARSYAQFG